MNALKNVPKAFSRRRVTEALASVAVHVTSARDIAASLKPIKTAALDLEEEEDPRPIITSISPRTTDALSDVVFTINGKNLTKDSVDGFELFLEDDPQKSFPDKVPAEIDVVNKKEATATVDLSTAPSGFYEVRITDENGTPHLPGFTVEIETNESSGGTKVAAPKIKPGGQPKPRRVKEGNPVALKVVASGTQPLSYQWLKDGEPISKKTDTFEIKNATSSDKGNYAVIVANTAGFVVSAAAKVSVSLNGE